MAAPDIANGKPVQVRTDRRRLHQSLDASLVALYQGADLTDSSGNGYHLEEKVGTIGHALGVAGAPCMIFNTGAKAGLINSAHEQYFRLIGEYTTMLWMRLHTVSSTSYIIMSQESAGTASADDAATFIILCNNYTSSPPWAPSQRHEYYSGSIVTSNHTMGISLAAYSRDVHVVMRRRIDTGVFWYDAWIDGAYSGAINGGSSSNIGTGVNGTFHLGGTASLNNLFGDLQSVAIYNTALADAAVEGEIRRVQPDHLLDA